MSQHPMDDIPVRQIRFDFDAILGNDPVWSRSCPAFAMFINALGIHVPHFERFLVSVMREYRDELADPRLRSDVQAIIGQEAHHAFHFVNWTRQLAAYYPGIDALDTRARHYFEEAAKNKDRRFKIGFTAGYETFTFLGGMIILNRYSELMADADPNLRALWVWHQVEEVEHGSVAFDFYKAFFPDDEWFRRYTVLLAFAHIATETFKAFRLMVGALPFRRKVRAWRFFCSFGASLAWSAMPVLSRSYHPRAHPICTVQQNRIAMAWRRYFAEGNDVRALTNEDMQLMTGE